MPGFLTCLSMIGRIQAIALALTLGLLSPALADDFPFDQFEPVTLADVVRDLKDQVTADPEYKTGDALIMGPFWRRRVQAIYTGQHRAIDAAAIAFYLGYEKAHAIQNSLADRYRDVYLFQEDGVGYWLPVQDQVASYFAKELKPGDPVELYLIVAGGYLRADGWNWVFPVEEFRTAK
ncbi:MAG TPA: hypothetical protein VN685_09430 [Rhizomicrobium sp.]|nr:hypothetical protein [Rhizomicrobium sp.]